MMRAVLPGMIARSSGSIINVASAVSSLKGVPNRAAYAATKGAIIALSRNAAADHAGAGVRINCVCPGTIATPSMEERIGAHADPEQARAGFVARQPMGRFGTATEVAGLIAYLAAPESAFVTGAAWAVDGGMTL